MQNLQTLFSNIAKSIRTKTGKTATIVASNFPSEIDTIVTPNNQAKSVDITSVGQTITYDSEYTGLSSVTVGSVSSSVDSNIVSSNIVFGKTILGVSGSAPIMIDSKEDLSSLESPSEGLVAVAYRNKVKDMSSSSIFSVIKFKDTYTGLLTASTGTWKFIPVDSNSSAIINISLASSVLDITGVTHTGETFAVQYTASGSILNKTYTKVFGEEIIDIGTKMQYDTTTSWNNTLKVMQSYDVGYEGSFRYSGTAWEQLSEGALSVISSIYEQVFEGAYGPVIVQPAKAITFATVEEMNAHTDVAENTLAIVYGTSYIGTYKLDSGVWTQIGDTTEELEIFEDLAETMGYPDEYEGTGGTDEEINTVLDEIIGGSV